MKNFEEGKEARISPKSDGATLEEYFSQVLPNYDRDRVYASDIKKIIQWYNLLLAKDFLEEDPQEDTPKS